jgi:hypothetical protein
MVAEVAQMWHRPFRVVWVSSDYCYYTNVPVFQHCPLNGCCHP